MVPRRKAPPAGMVENERRIIMTVAPDSFRSWLRQEITQVLKKKTQPPPFIVWCDPERIWKEILEKTAEDTFELWAQEEHELALRHRFYRTPRSPRVVYLPVSREKITYFKVFEIQAEEVIEISLQEALSRYGVDIPSDMLSEIEPLLPTHVKEWIDHPKDQWKELTVGNVKDTLVNDERILKIIASTGTKFASCIDESLFPVFRRRVLEDFGLPDPRGIEADSWRVKALAYLICTEAAELCPKTPLTESDKIIPPGPARERALQLLERWQKRVDLIDNFEALIEKAENTTSIRFWANNLPSIPPPLSSKTAEKIVFQNEIEKLVKITDFDELVNQLQSQLRTYKDHTEGFWGKLAKEKIEWLYLAQLAEISHLLYENRQIEKTWRTPKEAVYWYISKGWEIDRAGELLFRETHGLPGGLIGVRARIRRAYLRHVDQINSMFSELLSRSSIEALELQYVGDVVAPYIKKAEPTAFIILDAFRYDLGCRLAEMLNQGEPRDRAQVIAGRAPIPSITALGMPYALPDAPSSLQVSLVENKSIPWLVTSKKAPIDLTVSHNRREWLKTIHKVKDRSFLSISDIIDPINKRKMSVKTLGKYIFIFGSEFDSIGHEGQLQITGADEHLKRYAQAIRQLRNIGYSTVIVMTDHGFFHWDPEKDEILQKPSGDIMWVSRRAIVGQNLKHQTAISLPVTGSNLTCIVPRSVNAFKTYGGLGFFHGGATLQELIIPIVIARWPKRARKVNVVLKPITEITSLTQRIEIGPGTPAQVDLSGTIDANLLSRNVFLKVIEPNTGKIIFKSKQNYLIEPGGKPIIAEIQKLEGAEAPFGANLQLLVCDSDDEEILDKSDVVLKVELDEWF